LARQDGKRPDDLTLIPWQRGKPLTWDITVAHTLADSYVSATARSGGAAAEQAAVVGRQPNTTFWHRQVACFNQSQQRRLAR